MTTDRDNDDNRLQSCCVFQPYRRPVAFCLLKRKYCNEEKVQVLQRRNCGTSSSPPSSSSLWSSVRYNSHSSNGPINEDEMDQMKQEIAKLRAEAQQRLQALNEKLRLDDAVEGTTEKVVKVQVPPPQPQVVVAVSNTTTAANTTTTTTTTTPAVVPTTPPHHHATTTIPPRPPRDDIFQEAAMEFQESADLFEARIE
eukprot:CAMPEP_0117063932 /NCGR_PEP_ID=MMETSP0472-20121206/44630_1 /TAXON_ID=693140 ORGANISM="Tiarina fusus, Strain LIS" /NCGR_SAMPLE_ID=MMETSP0472 /ASSEMBLY_ACC=CAM_ASM_000603 /LENGTH=197 /DNA_ID=CAMNT_0004783831 /DNA_START=48 /DNA_END=638 /DNA_ORIENTATION=+